MLELVSSARGIAWIRNRRESSSSACVSPSRTSRPTSSSIDAIARSTFSGLTPARTSSGPSMTFASSEL